MGIVNLLLLIVLGLLGVAGWLRTKRPDAAGPLARLEAIGGWIGLVGFVWGLWMLLLLILNIGSMLAVPVSLIIALASAFAVTALSLILAMPTIEKLAGNIGAVAALGKIARDLKAFKLILGAACLGLAAYALIRTAM